MSSIQVVILAAGKGTRLGRPHPKPLTVLTDDGRTIITQQLDNIRAALGEDARVMVVVGFKFDMIMEAVPDVVFAYNEDYSDTNTNRSLLRALRNTVEGPVIWMNGDVVFDPVVLERLKPFLADDRSAIAVNTAATAEEEVKYTVDAHGHVDALSKQVRDALGEAVGVNLVSAADKLALIRRLGECDDQDYFERGIELAIEHDGMQVTPVDISDLFAVEVDNAEDLERANEAQREYTRARQA
ncbi:NTP transferase domain-containing protein [uncultured Jatrophihabitans sp.]|uniref:phosphocholine cytidylyltransferase family protein n=1 Tax=uncultured Jatrophihabitans sp. TaxID=1610747 RepID=UPI0035CB9131